MTNPRVGQPAAAQHPAARAGPAERERALPALTGLGLLISLYLTWVRLTGAEALCTGLGGCQTVQSSRFASAGDVPVALLGLLAYGALLALSLWRPGAQGSDELRRLALFGVALAGTLYSAYLTYLELFVLRAICPWCVASALLMAGTLALSVLALSATAAEQTG